MGGEKGSAKSDLGVGLALQSYDSRAEGLNVGPLSARGGLESLVKRPLQRDVWKGGMKGGLAGRDFRAGCKCGQ